MWRSNNPLWFATKAVTASERVNIVSCDSTCTCAVVARAEAIDTSVIPTMTHDDMVQLLQAYRDAVHAAMSESSQLCLDYLGVWARDFVKSTHSTIRIMETM